VLAAKGILNAVYGVDIAGLGVVLEKHSAPDAYGDVLLIVGLPQNTRGLGGVLGAAGEGELHPEEQSREGEAGRRGDKEQDTHDCDKEAGGWHGGTPFGDVGISIAEKRRFVKFLAEIPCQNRFFVV
jgi:hypothetical protein